MAMTTRQSDFRVRGAALALAFCMGAAALPQARADGIYLCVDANGRRELTDTNRRGCKEINVPGAIAAPPAHHGGIPAHAASAPQASVTPADFPKVDSAQQKARDNDRRDILNDELQREQRRLGDLRHEFNNGEPERQGNERNYAKYQERVAQMRDNISRTEKNIEALRREIASIK